MGMHTFVKAPHLQIAVSDYERKEIAARRMSDPNQFGFDSSPDFTIPKRVGFAAGTMRLELIHEDDRHRKFNVYGSSVAGSPDSWRGTLTSETAEEWRRRMRSSY